jgi:UDP-N-acetylmuramyl tripeptide synthase
MSRVERLRERAAVLAGRATATASRLSGRGSGSTLPGRIGLLIDPGLVRGLSRARPALTVSGTNGKTTTTRFLAAAIGATRPVVTNASGANLVTGVASALLASRAARSTTAVLEVDEFALPGVLDAIQARVIVLLNLSRDQLDRGGEVASHVARWAVAVAAHDDATVVANSDDPLVCAAVLKARPDSHRVVWVGTGDSSTTDAPLCPRCHSAWAQITPTWRCGVCGLVAPTPTWAAVDGQVVLPGGERLDAGLALPGRVNVANAAMALAAAAALGVPARTGLAALQRVTDVGGRYLRTDFEGRSLRLLLGKNPAGWVQVLEHLGEGTDPVVVAVNARTADGTDTSWLWDVPFERLRGRDVVAAGDRADDVSVRLLYADVPHTREADALAGVRLLAAPSTEVVANYTAFAEVRDRLKTVRGNASTGEHG